MSTSHDLILAQAHFADLRALASPRGNRGRLSANLRARRRARRS
ncbi:MAG TPA: hypothetical protein VHE83_04370 [Mycobacteriales bacterium]|nr:hypothetical protein [Mycobacteriales bacterium]